MNLHILNDPHGYNLNLVIQHCNKSDSSAKNVFINLNLKPVNKNEQAEYLPQNIVSFKKNIKTLPKLSSVTFYPLDYVAAYFLKELKAKQPEVIVRWVFWSYEFYHLPGRYQKLLKPFSQKIFIEKKENKILSTIKTVVKKLLNKPVVNIPLLHETYKYVDAFYSFLQQDFINVKNKVPTLQATYHQTSFLSIEQIAGNSDSQNSLSDEIIIGHSARLTGNHYEILTSISTIDINNRIFIPLAHGDADYKNQIKKNALQYFADRVSFLEEELNMQLYFKRISAAGFAVFNFSMQEGLGNILFLLWNGAKIFLQSESSAYIQFKAWGLDIFSSEKDLTVKNLTQLLDTNSAMNNKIILKNLFSENKVKEYWKPLFQ